MEPSVLASYTGLGTVRDRRSTFFNSLLVARLACVQAWSILEVFVEDFVVNGLSDHQEILESTDELRKLRGPLIEFAAATREEQMRLLVHRLSDSLASDLKPGVGGFETLLRAIGQGGSVVDVVRRGLLELSQVRNVFVHRGGVADARLAERCPWRGDQIGEHIHVGVDDAFLFLDIAVVYVLTIHLRAIEKWWKATAEEVATYRRKIEKLSQDILARVPDGRFHAQQR